MKRFILATSSAAIFGLTACGNGQSQPRNPDASEASALVAPGQVNAEQLQSAVSDERVRRFYEARAWRPAWTSDSTPALMQAIEQSLRHGLDPSEWMSAVRQAGSPVAVEAALSLAAIDLSDALANGRVDPNELWDIYTVDHPEMDVAAGLNQALEAGNVDQWLAGLAPNDPEYRALSEAFIRYLGEARSGRGGGIESGELIREGDADPRVPRIVEALRSNSYLGAAAQTDNPELYTPEIAAAVERMQQDYGIAADGVLGPETLKVLNAGPDQRARTLAVNLERRRWLERNAPTTRIDVNTAAAILDYYHEGRHRDRRKVIVGQPGWETPQLGSPIFRLVANPTWTVPKFIEEEEIAPKGSAYLARNNMVRRDGWIVQLPGPDNALGQVKFDMQNDHSIYLHDTPAQSLFSQNQRQFSHGCVRVENAEEFAMMLAEQAGVLAEFRQAMASGEETFVDLKRQIPVRLVYHTAFLDPSGQIRFRTDPYGWDERLAKALGYAVDESRRLSGHVSDIGP